MSDCGCHEYRTCATHRSIIGGQHNAASAGYAAAGAVSDTNRLLVALLAHLGIPIPIAPCDNCGGAGTNFWKGEDGKYNPCDSCSGTGRRSLVPVDRQPDPNVRTP